MKPSDIVLTGVPLTATMGRSEREHAAALLVRCCQVNGDEWQAVSPRMIGEAIKADVDGKITPMNSWARNPFFNPDFLDLADKGFAIMGDDNRIAFTESGFAAMARWTR